MIQEHINHIHWDGSIPAKALFEYYQSKGHELLLPEKDVNGNTIVYDCEADRIIKSSEELENFQNRLLTKYDIIDVFSVPVGAMQYSKDLENMAVAHCEYLQQKGVKSAETRFAPAYHTNGDMNCIEAVIESALNGFKVGEEKTGVRVNPIICINRETDLDTALDIVSSAIKYSDKGVCGIDLACNEYSFPPDLFLDAYKKTFDTSLRRTVHAGEMMGNDELNLRNVEYVLNNFRLDGIGHAIPLYKRPDLVEIMATQKIRLESNPFSNLHCGFINDITDLHLDDLSKQGVLVTINPDDPYMWPNGHIENCLDAFSKVYGDDFVETVARNSNETSWMR